MAQLFLDLFNMSITASWIILTVILLRFLFKRAPKRLICILWALVAIRLICPISFESAFSLIPSTQTIQQNVNAGGAVVNTGITQLDEIVNPIISNQTKPAEVTIGEVKTKSELLQKANNNAENIGDSSAQTTEQNSVKMDVTSIFSILWSVGMVALLMYAVISFLLLKKRVASSIRIHDNVWLCDDIQTPFVLGVIRPRIYLPSNISDTYSDYVLQHELAHLKRLDHWWKPLGFLLVAVYWFNPMIWLAYILFCRDIELACDEMVIRYMNIEDKKNYSSALLSLSVQKYQIAACPIAFGEVGVKARIKQVLNYKKPAFWVVIAAVVACVAVAVCFLTNPVQQKDTNIELSEELNNAVMSAIVDENLKDGWQGQFSCEDHVVLALDESKNSATVYAMVLYQSYNKMSETTFNAVAGEHFPVAITFDELADGTYQLKEYWVPADGSDYQSSIKKKFPMNTWDNALDTQKYIDEQQARCNKKATEFFATDGKNLQVLVEQKNFEEVKKYLALYPDDAKQAADMGAFVIIHGNMEYGYQPWNDFVTSVNNGNPDELVMVQYTTEGDPIFDYLYYNGEEYYHVHDSSRDNFGGDERYAEEHWKYMKDFLTTSEEIELVMHIFLTNNSNVDLQVQVNGDTTAETSYHTIELTQFIIGNGDNVLPIADPADPNTELPHNDLAYNFDMSSILVNREQVTSVLVKNAKTGAERKYTVLDGSNTFNEIMEAYDSLNVELTDGNAEVSSNVDLILELYDMEGKKLQSVIPNNDSVVIDDRTYNASGNGTLSNLIIMLEKALI